MSLLEARGLVFGYGRQRALDSFELTVEEGSIHGLIGPNGAGKSTCIDVLSGRLRPASGRVILAGRDITRRPPQWRRMNGLARSFQRTSVFATLTVTEQLDLAARRVGETDLPAIVEALGLEAHLDRPCASISYGDQRRVDVALALVGHPRLVLLDEPSAGLSAGESVRLGEHIRSLAAQRGLSVLLVEHHLEVVFNVCDRVTVMNLGSELMTGTPDEVRADDRVRTAYLGVAV